MVVDRDEELGWLQKEAGSLKSEVNAPYRNHLLASLELIEMQANMLEARRLQVEELEAKARRLTRESEHLLTLHAECRVPQEYLMEGGVAAAGEQLRGEIIKMMLECGALAMEIRPDIVSGGKICTTKTTVYATKSLVIAEKPSEAGFTRRGEATERCETCPKGGVSEAEFVPTKGEA